MTDRHLTDTSFASLGLPEALLAGVRESGFEFCTPIQAHALPHALAGRDVAGQAQTGTGKTAAFLLAAFNYLLKQDEVARAEGREPSPSRNPRAFMLAPTRELAVQIHKDAEALGKYAGYRLGLAFGGTGYDSQRRELEAGVDVLIGTPGRLIDFYKQKIYDLNSVQVMVLDEADRMFDLGFIKDIRFILRRMPEPSQRLNMLFSATLSYKVMELAHEHMNEPEMVQIEPDTRTADKVTQTLYHTAMDEKLPLLIGILRHMNPVRSLVFINTKDQADLVSRTLIANGFDAAVLSGDVPQTQRLRLLQEFTEGKRPVMVATDVAARGLHIPEVSHVFNFDLPQNAEDYVHRIGRTARAGASGDAISFACEKYVFSLPEIEDYIGHKISVTAITPELLPPIERVARAPRRDRDDRGARHGRDRGPRRGERPDRRPRAAERAAPSPSPVPAMAPAPIPAPTPTVADIAPAPAAVMAPTPAPEVPTPEALESAPRRAPSRLFTRRSGGETPAVG